ncbi:aminotransferase DegT [Fulvitalea axinellae]|uniref:Aminotransferase DegT n=1 Tax=Fulvitalea axinellae TaxID=1182444 RepID=A0AAU9DAS4_9BACT|nr:aminotransferase DegT [Fulvitalea axinellae]
MIQVTVPFQPPKEEYEAMVSDIWLRNWLTNNGPLVNEMELGLKEYLGLKHFLFVSNGTIALQLAIKALGLSKEIITTPFSYVATTSSIVWEGCTPVFVDIDPESFNIDPAKIEVAITEETEAILATHVYGNPCDIEAIQRIADKHRLKVIYDAAHCFGTRYQGESVLKFGDISTISFHATKLFHSVEGGGVVSQDPEVLKRLAYMRNFGHNGPESFDGMGINGKNSEFHAAMGLCNLKYADDILAKRKRDTKHYNRWLDKLKLQKPVVAVGTEFNYAYYPVVFETEEACLKAFETLEMNRIFARRYFYPTLSSLEYVTSEPMPVAEDISRRILCLPLYYQLTEVEIDMVCRIVLRSQYY